MVHNFSGLEEKSKKPLQSITGFNTKQHKLYDSA
jgi:hypothetical protein